MDKMFCNFFECDNCFPKTNGKILNEIEFSCINLNFMELADIQKLFFDEKYNCAIVPLKNLFIIQNKNKINKNVSKVFHFVTFPVFIDATATPLIENFEEFKKSNYYNEYLVNKISFDLKKLKNDDLELITKQIDDLIHKD